jgi:hypothetical protein
MHKVVVERPRWNPGPAKYGRRANLPDELLPKFEGIRRPYQNRKGLTDLLGPLRRWLQAQVGRPWNDVYSEACAVIKPDSVIRAHIKTHLMQFVERNTFMHKGKVCVLGGFQKGIVPVEGSNGWVTFYVHPESFLLCKIPERKRTRYPFRTVTKPPTPMRWLDELTALVQFSGIWYRCRFRPLRDTEAFIGYDYFFGQVLDRSHMFWRDRRKVHCFSKQQLSGEELKKHRLTNSSAKLGETDGPHESTSRLACRPPASSA